VMTGASRHIWEHSIPPVDTPRYSITFRTTKPEHRIRPEIPQRSSLLPY